MSNVPVAAASADGGDPTDTVSEYLIETIPGWNLEEFLDSSSAPFGFYKVCNSGFTEPQIFLIFFLEMDLVFFFSVFNYCFN